MRYSMHQAREDCPLLSLHLGEECLFIVPGYIISIFRAHFLVGQKAKGVDYSIKLITLSALNFLVSGWMIYLALAWKVVYKRQAAD